MNTLALAAVPDAPTGVAAVRGPGEAVVSFTAPVSNGGAAITSYTVTSSPGGVIATAASSPIRITGLTNGTSYTFTVTATNSDGTGSASSASTAITPTSASMAGVNYGPSNASGEYNIAAVTLDAAGNIYLVGKFSGATFPLDGVTLNRIGNQDVWVAKLDASRTLVWAKNFGGSGATADGLSIAVDGSGNVYLGGTFASANLTTPALTRLGTIDAYALKLDSSGNVTWAKNYGGSGTYTTQSGIAVDGSGNVYVTGYFQGNNLSTPVLTKLGTFDSFVLKLDSSGTTTWAQNFGGSGADAFCTGIAVDGSGNIHLGGWIRTGNLTNPALTKIGSVDAFAIKLNSSGALTWSQNFGGSGVTARGLSIAVDGSGNVYLGGTFASGNLTTPALTKIGSQDAFAMKLNSSGALTWSRNFGGSGATVTPAGIAADGSGNVYLGGSFRDANLTTPSLTKISMSFMDDAFALKLNSSGNATWSKSYGGSGFMSTTGAGIAADSSGNVYLGGRFQGGSLTTPALTQKNSAMMAYDVFLVAAYLEPSVPGAPTGVSGLGGNAQATVSFTAPASDGGAAITGYTVTSSPAGGTDSNAGSTSLSHVITGLTNGTSYTFTVTATNSAGTSSASSASSAVTPATSPGAPTSVAAVRGLGEAVVSFTAPVSNGGAAITSYTVTSSPGGVTATGASSPITITGLTNGTSYTFTVTATNSVATGSASSASSAITPIAASLAGVNFGSTGGTVQVLATAVDAAGNSYLAGIFSGQTTLVLGGVTLTKLGTQDGWLAKLDASRTVVWAKNIGGSGASVTGRGIAVDSAGDVYLSGSFRDADLSTPALTKIGTQDGFAIKYNSSGAITWTQSFGGLGSTTLARGIAVDGTGNVYLSGEITGANLTTPAVSLLGTVDALAMKLNSSGTITWTKNFGGFGASANTQGVTVDSSGNVYLSGDFMTANLTTPALTKMGAQDGLVLKLDSSGTTTWAKSFSGSGASITARGLALDSSGNTYFSGYFESGALTTPALSLIGTKDALAIKLDSNGTTTWAKSFGGAGAATTGRGIAVDSSGNIYFAGFFRTASMTTPALALTGTQDAFALKLNSSGAATWAKNFSGSGATATSTSIALDEVGNLYIGGYFSTSSLTVPTLTLGASMDAMLIAAYLPEPSVPGVPTGVTATAGNAQATVSFTAPAHTGGIAHSGTVAITGYTVTSSPGSVTATGSASPITVTGLTNGTSYTFTVTATNSIGTGSASSASSAVTPATTPTVTSPTSASVATTSATLGGNVTATGGASLTAVGVVYSATSANNNPQLSGTGVTNVTGTATTGVFTVSATGLTAGTAYSYAAYATNSQGTTYTSVGTFTTTVPTPTLTFTTPSTATVAVGATRTNAVTSTLSGGSYGAITYTSSQTSKATVNATTGVVTGVAVGTTTITATQAAASGFNATTSTTYTLTVTIGTPTITAAPTTTGISYGQTLASSTLSGGTANVAGTFTFTTTSTAPNAGTAAHGVTFTPTDTTNYTSTTTTANVTVAKATPTLTWATPSAITYGTTLSATQLNATSSLAAGTITYSPAGGTTPSAGTQTLTATFTPTDTANYNTATRTVSLVVGKATPTLTWTTPSAITYGTTLSATQLNATSSLAAGTITYSPASGTTPSAGTQTLTATFTPTDTANYNTATRTVSLVVGKATPALTWATPSTITYGTALSATQLNATSNLAAGTITYSPASGTTPSAGTQTLSATFTPTDTTNYNTATGTVSLVVGKATPTITWATPSTITYGTALSATQLNATASVAGTFAYSPASGSIPSVGTQTLSATFTPTDATNFNSASAAVSLNVIVAVPGAPTAITATSANGEATLTFTAPSYTGSSAITGYTIRATATDGSIVTVNATGSPAKITGLTPGKSYRFTITANNSAGSSDTSTTSDPLTISLVNQTITFASLTDRTSNSSSFALTATASSGLPVTYSVLSGPALLSGNVVDLTGATGTVKIRASQAGNATYAAAPDVEVSFVVTAGATQAIFSKAIAPTTNAVVADVAVVLPANARSGTLLMVSTSTRSLNGTVDFQIGAGGAFTATIQSTSAAGLVPLSGQSMQGAPVTYTISGSLTDNVLSGTIAPLGLVFTANVPTTPPAAASVVGFYKSTALVEGTGVTYSVVGANNEVLVLTQGPTVTTGGLTTLKPDNTFALTATGNVTLTGGINPTTTTATATVTLPGNTKVDFSGLSTTTKRTDRLINLSSRAKVGTGESVLITGFVVGGPESKRVLVRAVGPALSAFGLASTLPNPAIKIYQGSNLIAQNDDWSKDDAADIARLGAFAFTAGSKDAALLTTLAPGAYTAQIADPSGTGTGVALAEIYDASINPNADYQRLVNISSRGRVTPDEGVLIGGFVVTGNSPKTLLIRGIGPALSSFGIAGALADPALTIYQDGKAIATNEGWANSAAITTAAIQTGAFTLPSGSKDAAVVITLNPGAYTAQIKSAKNASSGVALIEIYEVP